MSKPFVAPDGEVRDMDKSFFARAKRGRPPLPDAAKKRRVDFMLDPDVASRLQSLENSSAFVNRLLRERLGL